MPNALARETSPYLLQHRDNPVAWLPWGPEALDRARELDRPLLVSIGYSSCHWCHVMERESFEDAQTAELAGAIEDRKSTRLNSSHPSISYAVFCLKKKKEAR